MAEHPYPFTKVFPKVAGLTGVSNVGTEESITLTKGVPGFMYTTDAAVAAAADTVELMAGNTPQNMFLLYAITAVAAGAGPAATEATVTFAAGPANADATCTVTVAVDSGVDIVLTHDFSLGDTAAAVAAAVQAVVDADEALTATVDGLVVTVTPTSGTNITKLEVAIA